MLGGVCLPATVREGSPSLSLEWHLRRKHFCNTARTVAILSLASPPPPPHANYQRAMHLDSWGCSRTTCLSHDCTAYYNSGRKPMGFRCGGDVRGRVAVSMHVCVCAPVCACVCRSPLRQAGSSLALYRRSECSVCSSAGLPPHWMD